MIMVLLALVALAAGFVLSRMFSNDGRKSNTWYVKAPKIIGIILAVVLLIGSCASVVPTGYTGILTTFGRVENRTISAGLNVTLPWQKVVKMDNRTQKVQITTSAFSSDIQQVDLQLSVNYCIDQTTAQELYRTVGVNYYENVMFPRVLENTKAVFSQYSAENLIASRDSLSTLIADATAADLASYGITIVSIAIEDIDFTDAFTNAVEAKQVAAQNKLTAETEQAQKTMEQQAAAERAVIAANAEAEQAIIAANADLEVVKIQAEASLYAGEREAEMNKRIAEALTDGLISYYWIKQWDGQLPDTVLDANGNYMISLGDIGSAGSTVTLPDDAPELTTNGSVPASNSQTSSLTNSSYQTSPTMTGTSQP